MSTPTPSNRRVSSKSRLASLAPAALVCATALLLLWVTPNAIRSFSYERTVHQVREASLRLNTPGEPPSSGTFLDQLNQASRDVAAFVRPSVVHITSAQDVGPHRGLGMSTGSGWVWDAQGHILTNWHVVANADQIEVQMHDGTVHAAQLVGHDATTDIAVIRIPEERLVPASRADPREDLFQGSLVFAFGSPMDFRFSMSQGIVSGLGRSVGLFRMGRSMGFENFIQVDAAINPGNSGGPLTNHRGEVIGMNTAIAVTDEDNDSEFSGIGLAIPLDMIESVATQLIDGGVVRKGYLGVSVVDQDSPVFRWLLPLGLDPNTAGLLVSRIGQREILAEAGLSRGDVITHYDAQLVSTADDFWSAVADDPDEECVLSIWRPDPEKNQAQVLTLTCAHPEDRLKTNIRLLTVIDNMARYYRDIGFDQNGVLVVQTLPGKPARLSGLEAGDIITKVNGRRMNSLNQLRSTISSMLPDSVVEVEFWRPDKHAQSGDQRQLSIPLDQLDMRLQ